MTTNDPIKADAPQNMGAISGSRPSDEDAVELAASPSGFDPARWTPFAYAHGYPDHAHPEITVWSFGTNGREMNGFKPKLVTQLYSAEQVAEIVAAAIAMEPARPKGSIRRTTARPERIAPMTPRRHHDHSNP